MVTIVLVLALGSGATADARDAVGAPGGPVTTGADASATVPYAMPRTRVEPLADARTGGQYELYIRLPESWAATPDRRYPVVYTTDAVWHMEMLAGAMEYLAPEVILVGVSWQTDLRAEEPFASRFRDYTVVPYGDPELQQRYHGGGAAAHLAFLRVDVVPFVESRYRADPARRTYFGYSLGSVLGAYAMLQAPETFDRYVLGSPALSAASAAYLAGLGAAAGDRAVDVFVSIGELETSRMAETRALARTLHRVSGSDPATPALIVIEDSDHGTAFPETVVRGLRWLSERP